MVGSCLQPPPRFSSISTARWSTAYGVPLITRDQVSHAQPDPDFFLAARCARGLGVGLLSGVYGLDELQSSGAYCVYEDPADLLARLDEIGHANNGHAALQ